MQGVEVLCLFDSRYQANINDPVYNGTRRVEEIKGLALGFIG